MKPTDIYVKNVSYSYEDYLYRTPIKFGGVALDRVTLLNVEMTVETRSGKVARGVGSMPLGNVWAWPTKALTYNETLAAMKKAANLICACYRQFTDAGHPILITHQLEVTFRRLTDEVRTRSADGTPQFMPLLATLVTASPFDAALHDAFGKAHDLNCFRTCGPDFLAHDLGHYLGPEFAGETLDRYLLPEPKARLPLYHLVGALDPLTDADVKERLDDGLPNTLGEWVAADGLTHLKIKLNGDDLGWDVDRVVGVNRVAIESAPDRAFQFSLDFNERCQTVEYLLDVLHRVQAASPVAFDRIQYIEQPTARDLKANRQNVMHAAAKLKPVVIDESLIDLESMQLAREMGYTGVAFKACKGQTQTLLMAAAAQKYGLFRCVQDLTCVGASLIHSASIAAHIPGVAAIESNGRQYCPAANAAWEKRFPGVFTIRDGTMNTAILNGVGLGAIA